MICERCWTVLQIGRVIPIETMGLYSETERVYYPLKDPTTTASMFFQRQEFPALGRNGLSLDKVERFTTPPTIMEVLCQSSHD